jgi:hypothetical protein
MSLPSGTYLLDEMFLALRTRGYVIVDASLVTAWASLAIPSGQQPLKRTPGNSDQVGHDDPGEEPGEPQ